ncbi:hypothetical protein ABPG74_012736 [Tetrahymena malaccensis]
MAESAFKVSDRIKLTNNANKDQEGTILYIGQLEGKEGIWIGVELDLPKGSHNGQFNGKQYFQGKDQHCMFVKEKHIQLIQQIKQVIPPKEKQQSEQPPPQTEKPVEKKVLTKPLGTGVGIKQTAPTVGGGAGTTGLTATAQKLIKNIQEKSTTNSSKISSSSSIQQQTASQSSQGIKQLEEQLSFKDSEINMLKEKIENNEEQLQQFTIRTSDLQNQNDGFLKRISELQDQNKALQEQNKTIQDELKNEQQKHQETNTQLLQSKENYSKLEEELDLLHEALKAAEESEQLVEGLTIEKETLEHKLDELKEQLHQKDTEIKQLKEEKQLADIQLEDAMKGIVVEGQDVSGDSVNTELIKANARLKQAVQLLNDQFELEKIDLLENIIELESKIESLPQLESKIIDLEAKILYQNDQIKKKNEDIEELKERLDEQSEAVEMVENLTEQNQVLEDKITELKKEIKSFKEIKSVNDELFENYDLTIKDLGDQINNLEYQIYEQKRLVQEKEEQINEQEKTIEKLKQRAKIYKEQSENMKLEASENAAIQNNSEGKQSTNIQKLLESQQELYQEKREVYKQYLESSLQSINVHAESKFKSQVYLSCIPDSITDKINSEGIKLLITIQKLIKKAELLHQELYLYLQRHTDQIIKEENLNIFLWITQLLEQASLYVYYLRRFDISLTNTQDNEELNLLIKSPCNSSFIAGGIFIELVLKHLMEDNISPKVSLDPIFAANNKLKDEETAVKDGLQQLTQSIEIQKNIQLIRVQLISKIFLNKYVNGLNSDILFSTLEKRIYEFSKNLETGVILNNLKLGKLVECNAALQIVFDSIQDEKIGTFFTPVKTELKDQIDEKEETDEQKEEREKVQQFRKVISDVANLLSSLNADADQKLQQGQVTKQNEILENNSYWQQTVQQIKQQIDEIEETIESEKKLSEELKGAKQKIIQLELEIDNLNKIKQTLEQRVVKLQITSEKVTVLEAEKKRFQDKEKSFKEATDIIQKELDNMKKKYKESQEEVKNLKNNPQIIRSSLQKNSQGPLQLKSSMSKNFGDTPKSGQRQSLMYGQFDEDQFDLVKYYETENNILRAKDLKDRIKTLSNESDNLKIFKKLKEKNNNENQISFLQQQLNKATNVHNDGLKILASKQVIDLGSLKDKNVTQKDQNIKEYLNQEHKQIEALKYEAYKICSEVTKKLQKNSNSFKQKIEIAQCDLSQQNLKKLGAVLFNQESAQPSQTINLTVSLNDWQKIKEVF